MLTKQRCQVSFFSLDVPSVFYLFFALSVLLFLLAASCLCALCTTTYMWTKAGIHRPFLPKREKKVICIFANIFIFHFRKILLFVFLEFFNSNFSLIFQKEEQVVVLSTCQSFEGWIGKGHKADLREKLNTIKSICWGATLGRRDLSKGGAGQKVLQRSNSWSSYACVL